MGLFRRGPDSGPVLVKISWSGKTKGPDLTESCYPTASPTIGTGILWSNKSNYNELAYGKKQQQSINKLPVRGTLLRLLTSGGRISTRALLCLCSNRSTNYPVPVRYPVRTINTHFGRQDIDEGVAMLVQRHGGGRLQQLPVQCWQNPVKCRVKETY
jgi:hypothetical protein